jgi:hypothetical protein
MTTKPGSPANPFSLASVQKSAESLVERDRNSAVRAARAKSARRWR